ncbi:MAG: ATP-binding protein [Fibrobacterales bacterium]
MRKTRILYVDDEQQNCIVFKATFKNKYIITTCTSAKEALELIKTETYPLIISDYKMPDINGVDFFQQSLNYSPTSIRVLVTAYSDIDTIVSAVNRGYIYQFISKPWNDQELGVVIENGLNKYYLEQENKELFNQISLYSKDLESLLKNKIRDLKESNTLLNKEVTAHKETIDKLEGAIEKSEEANEVKSSFLANMSHELRTPMHGILSFAQLGISKAETAPISKLVAYFQHINDSGQRLLTLLNNILDLAKLESKSIDYYFTENNVLREVDASIHEFMVLLDSNNIEIKLMDNLDDSRFTFDQIRVGQVLRNLILNAIKFSPANSTITLSLNETTTTVDSHPIPAVQCTLLDQGVGIPDGELENVFDKFIQSSKTNNGAGGTGLGLSICKEIIEAHGGTIWAQNRDDQAGAAFTFILPRSQEIKP